MMSEKYMLTKIDFNPIVDEWKVIKQRRLKVQLIHSYGFDHVSHPCNCFKL